MLKKVRNLGGRGGCEGLIDQIEESGSKPWLSEIKRRRMRIRSKRLVKMCDSNLKEKK